tara:strand:- start:1100 stop:1714 length:615 start_codon:yes stop_codon:yes gene_type:complete
MLKGIYAITPNDLEEKDLLKKVSTLFELKIPLIQLREKNRNFEEKYYLAKEILKLRGDLQTKIIINDDPKLAKIVSADGVHLGNSDPPYLEAREILGEDSIIGISCQNNINIALKAQEFGANYVAFGSVFSSKTKHNTSFCSIDNLKKMIKEIDINTVAIGGINIENVNKLSGCKVDFLAISSGLFDGDIELNYKNLISSYSNS